MFLVRNPLILVTISLPKPPHAAFAFWRLAFRDRKVQGISTTSAFVVDVMNDNTGPREEECMRWCRSLAAAAAAAIL